MCPYYGQEVWLKLHDAASVTDQAWHRLLAHPCHLTYHIQCNTSVILMTVMRCYSTTQSGSVMQCR